jgi:hypothetical protein
MDQYNELKETLKGQGLSFATGRVRVFGVGAIEEYKTIKVSVPAPAGRVTTVYLFSLEGEFLYKQAETEPYLN